MGHELVAHTAPSVTSLSPTNAPLTQAPPPQHLGFPDMCGAGKEPPDGGKGGAKSKEGRVAQDCLAVGH